MLFISKIADISATFAGFETLRCRIVLDDVVVPIDHPDGAIWSDLSHDRSGPLIVACQKVDGTGRREVCAVSSKNKRAHKMSRRPTDKGRFVPPLTGKCSGRVEGVTCPGGISTKLIDLPDVFRDWIKFERVRDGTQRGRCPTANLFVITIRDR